MKFEDGARNHYLYCRYQICLGPHNGSLPGRVSHSPILIPESHSVSASQLVPSPHLPWRGRAALWRWVWIILISRRTRRSFRSPICRRDRTRSRSRSCCRSSSSRTCKYIDKDIMSNEVVQKILSTYFSTVFLQHVSRSSSQILLRTNLSLELNITKSVLEACYVIKIFFCDFNILY